MCGRFTRATEAREFTDLIDGLTFSDVKLPPRFNIAPTQLALVAREHPDTHTRELVPLKWGLVPHWSKDTKSGAKMINARSESVATKPSFRDSFKARRCLVACDGWYEWKVTPAGMVPMFIHRVTADGEIALFFFAGLWASWHDKATPDAAPLETFTIVTRDAAPELAEIHDRVPVVLPQSAYGAWLGRKMTDSAAANDILATAVLDGFHAYPVSTRVNTPRNDDAACIAVGGSG